MAIRERTLPVDHPDIAESLNSHVGLQFVLGNAPAGEPLRLEFESFVGAVRGDQPVVVSGDDGREALAVALRIVREIERTLPSLSGVGPGAAGVASGSVARA